MENEHVQGCGDECLFLGCGMWKEATDIFIVMTNN